MAESSNSGDLFTLLKLAVVIILTVAFIAVLFGVITFLAGLAWFLIKLVIVMIVIFFVYRYFTRKP